MAALLLSLPLHAASNLKVLRVSYRHHCLKPITMVEHIEHIVLFSTLVGCLFATRSVVARSLKYFSSLKGVDLSADNLSVNTPAVNVESLPGAEETKSKEFIRFERTYLLVYLLVMLSDWMQGPYVYELYASYGYAKSQIALLFIVGFGSSMINGTFVGAIADRR